MEIGGVDVVLRPDLTLIDPVLNKSAIRIRGSEAIETGLIDILWGEFIAERDPTDADVVFYYRDKKAKSAWDTDVSLAHADEMIQVIYGSEEITIVFDYLSETVGRFLQWLHDDRHFKWEVVHEGVSNSQILEAQIEKMLE